MLVFSISCVSKDIQVTETYTELEQKQEPYAAKESYIVQELTDKQETIFDDTPDSVPYGIKVPLSITESDSELIGRFELPGSGGISIRLPSNKILYEQLGQQGKFQISLPKGEYTVILRDSMVWDEPVYLSLILKWTELDEVTKYREVTKNHEVPVQVEKQRTVTKTVQVPFWEAIFSK